ncbi:hypothetical protein VTK56DRAFT_5339 [Thermocarpiscus australiensis]
MTSGFMLFFAVCALLLCLTSAKTTNVVVNRSWQPRSIFDGALPDNNPVDDCTTEGDTIRQAFADALALAENARDVIDFGFRSEWWGSLFETLFRDKKGPFSRTSIRNVYDSIATNSGLPDEIVFHCGDGWRTALSRRLSAYGIGVANADCKDGSYAITTRVRSGDFPPDVFSDFGPDGAFRSGYHITLCPTFFNQPSLGNIQPVTADLDIDDQDNQGTTLLHELTHVYDRSIRDGGYGFGGCLDVANEVIKPGKDNVRALDNAETYAIYALGVTPVQDMDRWDWTTGYAKSP